jgi:hypothetical protein
MARGGAANNLIINMKDGLAVVRHCEFIRRHATAPAVAPCAWPAKQPT